ncbi:hypothetical protein BTVI_16091 [Pitangus sulphuratus]|nr:hypothetical protein BTVI_16091 [Pitangus sulphuratus]
MGPDQKQASSRSRSEPPKERKKAVLVSDQNGKGLKSERKRVPKSSLQKEGPTDDRERKERHEGRRLEKGKSQDYPDLPEKLEEGKVPDDEKQRKEDEYQTRYRSDPNLARYPVKPHPEEQQMRMHAKVSKARHERRHSDVALPHTEMEEAEVPENKLGKRSQLQGTQDRKSLVETQRSYSIDRTGDVRISVSKQLTNHSPPTPRHSPVPIEHVEYKNHDSFIKQSRLDPSSAILMRKAKREKMETMLRNDSLSSDQSESVRPSPPKPHRAKRGGKKRQMSVSSSEEEGASTPEYTSCEDVEIESESVSEKGDRDNGIKCALRKFANDTSFAVWLTCWREEMPYRGTLTGLRGDLDYYWLDPATWHSRETSPISSVVGGKMTELGRLGAFITKVKKGSLADVVGHLRAGSRPISDSDISDYDVDDGIGVVPPGSPEKWKDIAAKNKLGKAPQLKQKEISHLQASSFQQQIFLLGQEVLNSILVILQLPFNSLFIYIPEHINKEVPHSLLLQTHPSAVVGEDSYRKFQYLHATSIEVIGAVPAYLMVELDSLQLSLIMCRNWDVCPFSASLVVEERTRQMKMKVHRYNQTSGSGSSQEHEREQYTKYNIQTDQYRSCDNVSAKSSDSDVSDVSAISRTSSASRLSSTSFMSEQSERPRGRISTFTPKMQGRRMGTSGRITKSTSVSGEMYKLEHIDGSQSDTAVGMVGTGGKKRRSSFSAKVVAIVSRRSRSTSQLSQTGGFSVKVKKPLSSPSHYGPETNPSVQCCFKEVTLVAAWCDFSLLSTSSADPKSKGQFFSIACLNTLSNGQTTWVPPKTEFYVMKRQDLSVTNINNVPVKEEEGGSKKLKSTIQRSTETGMAAEMRSRMVRQPSRESTDGSINSYSSEGNYQFLWLIPDSQYTPALFHDSRHTLYFTLALRIVLPDLHISIPISCKTKEMSIREFPLKEKQIESGGWPAGLIFPGVRLGADSQFSDFLDGLGPAQLVGRQTLATPAMGDIQIGMVDKKGQLEVEVIRARGLTQKPGSKSTPAPYVKVYLLENGACIAKKKTRIARKTLDPLYQQTLVFEESPQGKVLQVIVWGDYGRMDHKCFMGVAQILLEELDLSSVSPPDTSLMGTAESLSLEVDRGTSVVPGVEKEPSASRDAEV